MKTVFVAHRDLSRLPPPSPILILTEQSAIDVAATFNIDLAPLLAKAGGGVASNTPEDQPLNGATMQVLVIDLRTNPNAHERWACSMMLGEYGRQVGRFNIR